MEKSPSERKPNRVFRGQIIRAAIQEALEFAKDLGRPMQSDTYCSGDWDEVGIGASTEIPGQLTIESEPMFRASDPRRFDDPFPHNWEQDDRS